MGGKQVPMFVGCWLQCEVSEKNSLEIFCGIYKICFTIRLSDFLFGNHTLQKENQTEEMKLYSLDHLKCSITRNWTE